LGYSAHCFWQIRFLQRLVRGAGGGQMVRNTRPGIAYRPDARTVLAIDAYNLVPGEGDTTEWSYGVERRIGSHVRIRTGFYHIWPGGEGDEKSRN